MANQPSHEEQIFNTALQCATREERAAYLKGAWVGDAALLQRVIRLPRDVQNQASYELTVLLFVRHETANEIGNFVGGGIQGEVPRIKDVILSLRNVTVVRLGLRQLKR
jgi:hypothetical protein